MTDIATEISPFAGLVRVDLHADFWDDKNSCSGLAWHLVSFSQTMERFRTWNTNITVEAMQQKAFF